MSYRVTCDGDNCSDYYRSVMSLGIFVPLVVAFIIVCLLSRHKFRRTRKGVEGEWVSQYFLSLLYSSVKQKLKKQVNNIVNVGVNYNCVYICYIVDVCGAYDWWSIIQLLQVRVMTRRPAVLQIQVSYFWPLPPTWGMALSPKPESPSSHQFYVCYMCNI